MEGEDVLVSELADAINAEDNSKIKSVLSNIISQGKEFKTNIVQSLTTLLHNADGEIKCLTARAIAEQSICEEKRKSYSNKDVILMLLEFLKSSIDASNLKLIKQTCRALGNICCDNYVGRDLILSLKGISFIIELLPKTIEDHDSLNSECSSVRLCVCKLLLNLLLGGTNYIEAAIATDITRHIYDVLLFEFKSNEAIEECLSMLLLVVSVILDNKPSLILKSDFNLLVVDILKETKNIEISEMCLEHLHAQSEHDDVKNILAQAKVPQLLWSLLQQHSALAVNEEKRAVMKLACDLIVLILTGDESMDLLYSDGSGEVYSAMVGWLNAEDMDLVTTAVLAIGNFARTDTHCLYMMDSGVFDKLLAILSLHKSNEDDIRLQHAVLSTLRNLVVPQINKPLAIEKGILPVLTEMLPSVTQYHVVFKLLATLRMLVDGQESVAVELVSSGILEQVVQWAARWEHPGVTGEAQRLLAWSVRQLHSSKDLAMIIHVDGCVSCLVNMLVGTHAIMQNEAIISLTILCTLCILEHNEDIANLNINDPNNTSLNESSPVGIKLINELIKADVGKQLKIMIEANFNNLQCEIIENICKFMKTLLKSNNLKVHLRDREVYVGLERVVAERSDCQENIKETLDEVINEIKNTVE